MLSHCCVHKDPFPYPDFKDSQELGFVSRYLLRFHKRIAIISIIASFLLQILSETTLFITTVISFPLYPTLYILVLAYHAPTLL